MIDKSILVGPYLPPNMGRVEAAQREISPYPGRFVVEMDPLPEQVGSILIAQDDLSEARNSPDSGTVIAVGRGVPLIPGERVLVDHSKGRHIQNFIWGEYEAPPGAEVRLFGVQTVRDEKRPRSLAYWASALASMNESGSIKPFGTQVLLLRVDIKEKSEGGVYLPESAHSRPGIAKVIAVGEEVRDVKVNTIVMYQASDARPVKHLLPGSDPNLAIIDYAAIFTELEQ